MNVQETLAQIDHIMTEVDLELYEWQTATDMMSFLGTNATFAMWTNEVPPRVVTSKNITLLPFQGIEEVRVMHFTEEGWSKVGTARIDGYGNFEARLDHDIPGLTDTGLACSIDESGKMFPLPAFPKHPPFEGLNKPLTIRDLHEAIAKLEAEQPRIAGEYGIKGMRWGQHPQKKIDLGLYKTHSEEVVDKLRENELENHPFFNNKEND